MRRRIGTVLVLIALATLTVGGVTIPLGDNRLLKARFEKYLSQPPENDEEANPTIETLSRYAEALGKQLAITLV